MFINWLTKLFIKNYDQLEREEVRTQYVYIAGIIGILANILLFIVKFSVGVLTGSIAVMADAFNNFSDTASSVITMIGVKLANLPADKRTSTWTRSFRIFISFACSFYGDVSWSPIH